MPQHLKKYQVAQLKKSLTRVVDLLEDELSDLCADSNSKPKRIWMRERTDTQSNVGAPSCLLIELPVEYPDEWCLRLRPKEFDMLLNLVAPRLQRMDTLMRASLTPKLKLQVALNFLATGNNYQKLSEMYRVSKTSISFLIPEVCSAIHEGLKDFIKTPSTEQEWLEISHGFETQLNFPKCCGALDGKHFVSKSNNSVILIALVDHNYCFTYIELCCSGVVLDNNVFQNSSIYKALENGLIPSEHYVVANNGFPFKEYIMKPYNLESYSYQERVFNYRLERARRVADNAFGVLASRFRIFEKPIMCKSSTVDKIVTAASSLHNWLMKTEKSTYFPSGTLDSESDDTGDIIRGQWRSAGIRLENIRSTDNESQPEGLAKRDNLKEYFLSDEGAVPWQETLLALVKNEDKSSI